jgi:hypothetical protein
VPWRKTGTAGGEVGADIDVDRLPIQDCLDRVDEGLQNSLDSQLLADLASFNAGNTTAGINQLGALVNHVRAQRGKGINAAVADVLIAFAQRIIRAVG